MAEHPENETGTRPKIAGTEDYGELTSAVRDLVQVMRQGDLDRLELRRGDLHILLCAKPQSNNSANAGSSSSPSAPLVEQTPVSAQPDSSQTHYITSPMVGTYYEAPSPGDAPFVRAGDTVVIGQTVAIIEAMKIMNEIVADRPGTIEEVLVQNGETVEYGHPLFRLRPAQ